jgi:hypothetical protein
MAKTLRLKIYHELKSFQSGITSTLIRYNLKINIFHGDFMTRETSLKMMFYSAYDASLIAAFITKLAAMKEPQRRSLNEFLGEGTHFQSFEINTTPIPLALNIAKHSFTQRGEAAVSRWRAAVELARSLEDAELIPPMDVVHVSGLTAIVLPKGHSISRCNAKTVDASLLEASKALGQAGLVLDDYPQVREAQGVPFIIDWSDLTFLRDIPVLTPGHQTAFRAI